MGGGSVLCGEARTSRPINPLKSLWLKVSKKKPRSSSNTVGSRTNTPGTEVGTIFKASLHPAKGADGIVHSHRWRAGSPTSQVGSGDEALPKRKSPPDRRFSALARFDRSNENGQLQGKPLRAGVKPCTPRQLHTQLAKFEISSVQVCKLEFTTP
jgi:hypothetical protein